MTGKMIKLLSTLLSLPFTASTLALSPQVPLKDFSNSGKVTALALTNCWHFLYTTEIAVGNPPQYFTAIVDTSNSDAMVPSANCSEPWYCDSHPLYNSSKSSTYEPDGTPTHVVGGLFTTWGNASIDSFHIGQLEVKHQMFAEATVYRPPYFLPSSWHDAALTLSRKVVYNEIDADLDAPSPFQNMVEQGLLERNVFSLKLPRKVEETGLLLLGARGNDYNAETAVGLPLHSDRTRHEEEGYYFLSGGWEVEPLYLSFGHGQGQILYDLSGHTAALTSWGPFLDLPKSFGNSIMEQIGANMAFGTIKCDQVTPALPNLTIALRGIGDRVEEFVMTYEDYAMDIVRPPGIEDDECQLPFFQHEETEDVPKYIVLGTPFLRKYYSTFDEDSKSVIRE